MVSWPITQIILEFVAAASYSFGVQARNPSDLLESAIPQPHGLAGSHPTTLLLVQPTDQQIEFPVCLPFRMITRLASSAAALMNLSLTSHGPTPFLGVGVSLH